ncbi:hypothetical protein NDN13_16675 [Acinetobacter sp. C32I]|uniref:hypothetical protein n=1 Tax=Acinetobacter sp. C32I TaxID=2950074 RepID=UPI0020371557|nr:hypothetical protein [Acinetobacter sp. C32I]USA53053.1 hypothetical protein NDN13_16675 [Acinetobacter sp. C32I]
MLKKDKSQIKNKDLLPCLVLGGVNIGLDLVIVKTLCCVEIKADFTCWSYVKRPRSVSIMVFAVSLI